MAQNTNLNISPYFDDFDDDKGFLKVLFKPGFPVQARELTTLQSLLQNQIDTFGQGVYKEGSMVVPGGITLNRNYPVVLVQNNYLNLPVELYREALNGKVVKGATSNIRARVNFSISSTTSTRGYVSFYVTYLSKADDNTSSVFQAGEILTCEEDITYSTSTIVAGTPLAQLLNSNSTAVGSTANVGKGVYFVRGYFVPVAEQTLVLDQYSNNPSYKVGLKVEERIITADEDATLYDNAIGSTNFSAPGADRFKINLSLVKKNLADPNSADFIELLRTNVGAIENKVERSDLGFINDVLATRTKEESGDYYVKRFSIDVRENLNDAFNNGVYTADQTTQDGNTPVEEHLAFQISPGTAYVSGYRTEKLANTFKDVVKPRTFVAADAQSISSDFGNFVTIDNLYGGVQLYDTIQLFNRKIASGGSSTGTAVGNARVFSFSFDNGARDTTATVYRVGLADVDLYTNIILGGAVTMVSGKKYVGMTSGATGFSRTNGSASNITFEGVTGTFQVGEAIALDEAPSSSLGQTISSLSVFQFTDAKSLYKSGFTADIILDLQATVSANAPVLSGQNSNTTATLTASLSNFVSQLRVNDILAFSNNDLAHEVRVTGITSATQIAIERVTSNNIANGAINGNITLLRPQIREAQKRTLISPIPKDAVKSTSTNSSGSAVAPLGYFRKSYAVSVTGGAFSLSAGSNLAFRDVTDADDFQVIATAGTNAGTSYTVGNGISTTSSPGDASASITGLNSGTSAAIVIATVYSSNRTAKAKTTQRMKVLRVDHTSGSSANGLTQTTAGYGHRLEDKQISLGCADVFALKAIYESSDDSDPEIPNFGYSNLIGTFAIGQILTGASSGAKAQIVSFNSTTVYFVMLNDNSFTGDENISTPTAAGKITVDTIRKGSNNITSSYELDNGQREQYYDYSRIVRKAGYAAPTRRILVIFDRFQTTSGDGFYSVDSYSTEDYKEIPSFGDVSLRNGLDFRPMVPDAISSTGTRTNPYLHSATKYFDFSNRSFSGNLVGIPGQADTTILSYEYYLGRIDKVGINNDAKIVVVSGQPSETPVEPADPDDAMLLATVEIKPYVFDIDEDITITQTNYKRYTFRDIQQLESRIKTLEYYTQLSLLEAETATFAVRDTNGMDRFKNGFIVDNFASLATSDTFHPDYRVSVDFEEGHLRPAHYTTNLPLIVSSTSQNIKQTGDLITLPYTDIVLVDQPYASALENVNPFNVFTFIGDIKLTPASDDWVDTKSLAAIQGPVVEGNYMTSLREFNADQNGITPIQWGSWQTTWSGKVSEQRQVTTGKGKRRRTRTQTFTRIRTDQTRTGVRHKITPIIEQQSLGNKVVSVEHIQNMRSRNIEFKGEKLKPKTRFYPFFDGVDIKAFVTPKLLEVTKNPNDDAETNSTPFQVGETVKGLTSGCSLRILEPNDNYTTNPYTNVNISSVSDYTANLGWINLDTSALAAQALGAYSGNPIPNEILVGQSSGAKAKVKERKLISDPAGFLKGTFFIPDPSKATNPKFKTGTRIFRLSDTTNDSQVQGESESSAQTEYAATGILQTTQETIISVRNAQIDEQKFTQNRTLWSDPLAQTFLIQDENLEGGVFLTKIDLFFQQKDTEIPVAIDIRTVENGTPTQTIVPFSKVIKKATDVVTSTDASTPTTFTFESPVFIGHQQEHAIVVTSDSNQYKVFISLLGEDAIDAAHAGEKISEQPYIGVLFKSQNASTWTPSQFEDLMFKIYRADFTLPTTLNQSKLILNNATLEENNGGFINALPNAIATTDDQTYIDVFHSNHGMQSSLNYVVVDGVKSEVGDTTLKVALSASGVSQITLNEAANFHVCIGGNASQAASLSAASGNIGPGNAAPAVSNTNPGFLKIGDEIIAYEKINTGSPDWVVDIVGHNAGSVSGRNWDPVTNSGAATGTAHLINATVECYNLAGIPLTKINGTHHTSTFGGLTTLNSPHKYRLNTTGIKAHKTLTAGGDNVTISQNIPWDVLTPAVQVQAQPGTSINARALGTSGTSAGPFPTGYTAETSFVKDTTFRDITLNDINYFLATKVIASKQNEISNMSGGKSLDLELNFFSDATHLSPVVDTQRMSVTTTANLINNAAPTQGVGDENAAIYLTRLARLDNSATGVKVAMAANNFEFSEIQVMYKLVPVGYTGDTDDLNFEFFNTDGRPDSGKMVPQNDPFVFGDYEYTLDDAPAYDGFQLKIVLKNYNQPYIPRVKDLRIIALA